MQQTTMDKNTAQIKKRARGIETRANILKVTQRLLAKHDYYSVTLDQISKEAGVSKSSLLWHFESKEFLLSEAACELFTELEQAIILVKIDDDSMEQRLKTFIDSLGIYFQANPEPKGVLIGLIFNSQVPEKVRERIDAYWQHHIDTIVYFFSYPDIPFSKEAASAVLDVIHGSYLHWYLHKDKKKFKQKLTSTFKYMLFT